jgi:anti-anti-sigma regulatory factor
LREKASIWKGKAMTVEFEVSGDTGVLTIAGDLTIGHARELKAALLTSMVRASQVTVKLGRVTALDLSCLQVLCSAHRSFHLKNKGLIVCGEGHEVLRKEALRAGFFNGRGCDFSSREACLWAGGGK